MQRQIDEPDDIFFENEELSSLYSNATTHTNCDEHSMPPPRNDQDHSKRNLLCFWLIGLCSGIGDSVLSSASFDVIKRLEGGSDNGSTIANNSIHTRDCIADMPAVLLMANTIPSLALKLILPFVPFYTKTNIISACTLAIASLIIVAMTQFKWQTIIGIILMSISSDLSDITTISYLVKFRDRKKIIVSYSSGSGFSAVIASFIYAALCEIGFTPTTSLYLTLVAPVMGLLAFLSINESNATNSPQLLDDAIEENESNTMECPNDPDAPPMSLSDKLRFMPKLSIYFYPILINCLFEDMISQTFDLLYVPGTWLNHADQYRWIQAISNFGSLFGRMALSIVWIDDIWALNLLTGTFLSYFLFESIYLTIPNIWVIFTFVFVVEFISDYTIFNVYYRQSNEIPPNYQVFAVCCISFGLTIGVTCSGFLAIPIHAAICNLPPL